MTGNRAAQLREAATRRRGSQPAPVHWPSLKADEAAEEWDALREWVERLRVRFPHALRLPDCWWQHNDLVEILAALRDCERACYAATSAATGPIEWHRALRDVEPRVEAWTKRFGCAVTGRGHESVSQPASEPPGWQQHVEADINRRQDEP